MPVREGAEGIGQVDPLAVQFLPSPKAHRAPTECPLPTIGSPLHTAEVVELGGQPAQRSPTRIPCFVNELTHGAGGRERGGPLQRHQVRLDRPGPCDCRRLSSWQDQAPVQMVVVLRAPLPEGVAHLAIPPCGGASGMGMTSILADPVRVAGSQPMRLAPRAVSDWGHPAPSVIGAADIHNGGAGAV
ncbi:MAG: hypothetical protein Q8R28_22650, partial [Dehalococcoidia bacterium]|nr:hypothetical protein [Dehalococcoidia bacterium]